MADRISILIKAFNMLFAEYSSDDSDLQPRAGFADLLILSSLAELKQLHDEDAEEAEDLGAFPDFVWKKNIKEVMASIIEDGWILEFSDETTLGEVTEMVLNYIAERDYIVPGHLA